MANDNLTLDRVIKEVKSAEITKHQDQILQNNSSAADISEIHHRKVLENKRRSPKPKQTGDSSQKKQKLCYRCGAQQGHPPQRCPAKDDTCNACNKKGHYFKVCKSSKRVQRVGEVSDEDDISVMSLQYLCNISAIHGLGPKYLCDLLTFKSSLYNLRSSDSILLSMPAARSKTLGAVSYTHLTLPTIYSV